MANQNPIRSSPRRSESVTADAASVQGAVIEKARVVTVNIREYTVDAHTELTFKPKYDIQFMTPYCNQTQGEGINFMPEVGATCWVCTPSEPKSQSFVIGWRMTPEGKGFRGGRELLNPGDLHFSTRDGNFIWLRRGGIVQIGSTPVCQRTYLPILNVIQDYAENYELHTPGGDLTWKTARKEEDSNGHQACLFTLAAKEFADDPNEKTLGLLKFGSHGEGDDTILTLLTRDSGGGAKKTSLSINKDGDVVWDCQSIQLNVEGDADFNIDGMFSLIVGGTIDISAVGAMTVSAASLSISAGGASFGLGSGAATLDGSQITIGGGTYPVLRASADFVQWMGLVNAALVGPLGIPGQPVLTIPILPPAFHTNPKVKV